MARSTVWTDRTRGQPGKTTSPDLLFRCQRPETSVEIDSETYDWREWVNEYINESKRHLTVRRFYLCRIAPDFSMPETSVEIDSETYDWREWVNEYINESKRHLTVRRIKSRTICVYRCIG
jgi:sporulation-control protein spo0M